jgi:ATP:corrinoid adenosyltransferase
MDFNEFRNRFSESDRSITLEQYRALILDELNDLIRAANLSRPDVGQARLFHPSSQPGKIKFV